jgi:hypothetical protein
MLQEEVQLFAAADASFTVTRTSIYRNQTMIKYLEQQNPLYGKLYDIIINHGQLRPQLPAYQNFSQAIQSHVFQILTQPSPNIDDHLLKLQDTLQGIVSANA